MRIKKSVTSATNSAGIGVVPVLGEMEEHIYEEKPQKYAEPVEHLKNAIEALTEITEADSNDTVAQEALVNLALIYFDLIY